MTLAGLWLVQPLWTVRPQEEKEKMSQPLNQTPVRSREVEVRHGGRAMAEVIAYTEGGLAAQADLYHANRSSTRTKASEVGHVVHG